MATNVVSWLRDYLTARDLSNEVAGGLAVELPPRVRSVAITALTIFGVLCGVGAMVVLGGAIAVVLMPILMGREGVGTAMITLFVVCVTFVLTGILLLAARSAARVIRRERSGVRALYSFSVAVVVVAILAFCITQWLSVAFFGMSTNETDQPSFDWSIVVRVVELLVFLLFARVAFVMRRFDRDLTNAVARNHE